MGRWLGRCGAATAGLISRSLHGWAAARGRQLVDLYVEKFHIQLRYGWSVAWVKLYGTARESGEQIEHLYTKPKQ